MGTSGSHDNDRTGTTVSDAARMLGISEGAVRKRVERGKLAAERAPDGRLVVILDRDTTATDTTHDRTRQSRVAEPATAAEQPLVVELRDRITYLERQLDVRTEELKEHRRLLAAALERIPPAIEAPPDERDAPETVEEKPEGAEPRSDASGAQAAAGRPQQRNGWRAPVNKLPWWHYVLGLVAIGVASVAGDFVSDLLGPDQSVLAELAVVIGALWLPSSIFGLWVGLKQMSITISRRVVPFGLLLSVVSSATAVLTSVLTSVLYDPDLTFSNFLQDPVFAFLQDPVFVLVYFVVLMLPSVLLYVSGVLIGGAWRRRRTGRMSGIVPASPLSRTTSGSPGSRSDWTPRQQAILGFAGTLLAALISFMGTIFSVIVASGS